ncbi:MAG: DUF1343 domain-containing protein [Muribaculaceae bacterium]|nr:DUF1343 domain-containing protein [Muribaculaceae bacterium]
MSLIFNKTFRHVIAWLFFGIAVSCQARTADAVNGASVAPRTEETAEVRVGAARTDLYLDSLKGKRIALLSNHTGMVGDEHTLDLMLRNGLNVTTIFSPEHGFRGTADAGEHVKSSVDKATGIPIASLYEGKTRMPSPATMDKFDVIVTDLQDVGLRFYTYYISMMDLMNAAAKYGKEFMVFDRPNPNGMTVDGPVLDMKYSSGVGRIPVPAVHGMTMGELAQMIVGEGWLKNGAKIDLSVIPVENYTHRTRYTLPVAPSPNLPDMKAIYLYPSTCLFEGTPVSLGRGTDMPFQVYGHPAIKDTGFSFTPVSRPGAKNPPLLGKKCYGVDLRGLPDDSIIARGMDPQYVIDAYNKMGRPEGFFTRFFNLLAGSDELQRQIIEGMSAEKIKQSWQPGIEAFRKQRAPYLIYPE